MSQIDINRGIINNEPENISIREDGSIYCRKDNSTLYIFIIRRRLDHFIILIDIGSPCYEHTETVQNEISAKEAKTWIDVQLRTWLQ